MGKKSVKGKEKKLKRKEEILKLNEAVHAVKIADQVENPLKELIAFHKFSRNGLDLRVECKLSKYLSEGEFNTVFGLVEKNMRQLYDTSSWGWNEKLKKEEMSEHNARYLLAYDADENIVGMSHFRFDVEDDVEIVYCYEIHLDPAVRRKGLGKFFMQILELMAVRAKMKKVMLTVFKANDTAVDFFTKKMKYTVDDTSPQFQDHEDFENVDYEIYSKCIVPKS